MTVPPLPIAKACAGDYTAIAVCLREWRAIINSWARDDYDIADVAHEMRVLADALDPGH